MSHTIRLVPTIVQNTTPVMTTEDIDFDPPMYGSEPLADFIQQLRGIQDRCPENVIPTIQFRVVTRYDDTDIEGTVSFPRMETQREADYRGLWEAREKAQRHAGYLKLKAEFEPS